MAIGAGIEGALDAGLVLAAVLVTWSLAAACGGPTSTWSRSLPSAASAHHAVSARANGARFLQLPPPPHDRRDRAGGAGNQEDGRSRGRAAEDGARRARCSAAWLSTTGARGLPAAETSARSTDGVLTALICLALIPVGDRGGLDYRARRSRRDHGNVVVYEALHLAEARRRHRETSAHRRRLLRPARLSQNRSPDGTCIRGGCLGSSAWWAIRHALAARWYLPGGDGAAERLSSMVGRAPDYGELFDLLGLGGPQRGASTALLRELMRSWPDGATKRLELVESSTRTTPSPTTSSTTCTTALGGALRPQRRSRPRLGARRRGRLRRGGGDLLGLYRVEASMDQAIELTDTLAAAGSELAQALESTRRRRRSATPSVTWPRSTAWRTRAIASSAPA